MSVWDDIDRLKKKFEAEFDAVKSSIFETHGGRAANSFKIREGDGFWRVLVDGREYVSRTSKGLLEQLPKPKLPLKPD